jgi:hypothetical protein
MNSIIGHPLEEKAIKKQSEFGDTAYFVYTLLEQITAYAQKRNEKVLNMRI